MQAEEVLGALLQVERRCVDEEQLRRDLWVVNQAAERAAMFNQKSGREGVALFTETKDHFFVPRSYSPPYKKEVDSVNCRNDLPRWPSHPWRVHRALRPHQHAPFSALCGPEMDKTLVLGCGRGKTTLALHYAAKLGVKTLVIVDRDVLVDQWNREIHDNLGFPLEAVGRVQGNIATVGQHVTVAMVHTLSKRIEAGMFDGEFFDQFGLVIVDEAHVMSAPTFGAVLPKFPGRRLCLSATPERQDEMEAVYLLHSGGMEPCYTNIERMQSSTWVFVALRGLVPEKLMAGMYRRVPGITRPVLNRAKFDTLAMGSPKFDAILVDNARKACVKGRQILALGNRTEQLERLATLCQNEGIDASYVTGRVKKGRTEALDHQMLFVTDKIGSKGLDRDVLDTLFLLYPSDDEGFLRQAVGRIERDLAGKKPPMVVVFYVADVRSLDRKADKMRDAVRRMDPKAKILNV